MKKHLIVKGGQVLSGECEVSGSKNAVLPILAASIMIQGQSVIENVPNLLDVQSMLKMLNALNINASLFNQTVTINNQGKPKHIAPYDLVTTMRASFLVAGPILAMNGYAKVALPGGCSIGARPVDIHLKGLECLGADVSLEHGFVTLKTKKLKGNVIDLGFPSVGATEHIMMTAALAEGESIINQAAREPEIIDLANFLNKSGAKIEGAGTPIIKIQGVQKLEGCSKYEIIPDRIELITFLIAAAITRGEILIRKVNLKGIESACDVLKQIGVVIQDKKEGLYLDARNIVIKGVTFKTEPFPGFPTDMQAQFMALLSLADGTSIIRESIFENRFMHVPELIRMGADIQIQDHTATIIGKEKLSGADVNMTDLRAGAALVLAALVAEGYTKIYGVHHLMRGYDDLPAKLRTLGAEIAYG